MSRQRTVTQIDAKARRLLAGFEARGLLLRRGEGRVRKKAGGEKRP
jgi:hypothetical protein